jgi:hypothetical protein
MERTWSEVKLSLPWRRAALVGAAALSCVVVLAAVGASGVSWLSFLAAAVVCLMAGVAAVSAFHTRRALREQGTLLRNLLTPLQLAPSSLVFERYLRFGKAMTELAGASDPLHREFALRKLDSLCEEIEKLAEGRLVFHGTETWRAVYRELLESLTVKSYLSVSWVRSGDYWNDAPGRNSMRFNYELLERGFRIERILILAEELWPFDEPQPTTEIRPWIDEQGERGVSVQIVRESDLAGEPDLMCDFGIYGDRAVGVQELDEQSRTVRFVLSFDERSRQQAHERWMRLLLFASPLSAWEWRARRSAN